MKHRLGVVFGVMLTVITVMPVQAQSIWRYCRNECYTDYRVEEQPYWTQACGYGSCDNVVRYQQVTVPYQQCERRCYR
jgi:hypothetical protein